MPYLSIPQQIKLPVQTIGASAYYIYLTHMIFVHIVKNGLKIPDPLLNTVVALVGGVLVWSGVQALQGLRAKRRSQAQRMSTNTL
jgi:fucose 4-O-acetylase-like acetyltransferase